MLTKDWNSAGTDKKVTN